jgi:hypothetical protein
MSSENRKSKDSTTTTPNPSGNASINVSQIVDAANENVTKLVNESSRVQPQYAQAISTTSLFLKQQHHMFKAW